MMPMCSKDCLLAMLEELRADGATFSLYDGDRREVWFDALAQVIAAVRADDQRMAWVALIADDLCRRIPGVPFAVAAQPLLNRLTLMGGGDSMKMLELTELERDILRHALGLDRCLVAYRNSYSAAPRSEHYPILMGLVSKGLMERTAGYTETMIHFRVTDAGREAVQ